MAQTKGQATGSKKQPQTAKPNITPALVPKILPNTQQAPAGKPQFVGDQAGGVYGAPQQGYQPATSLAVPPQQYPGIPGARPPVNPNATGGSLAGDKQGALTPSGYQHATSGLSNFGPSPTQGAQDLRTLFNPPSPYPGVPQPPTQAPVSTGGQLAGDKRGGTFNAPTTQYAGDKQGKLEGGTGQGTVGNASSANANYANYLSYEQRVADVSYAFQNYTGVQNSALPNIAQPGDRSVLPPSMIASDRAGGYTPWTQYTDNNGNPFPSEKAFMDFMGYADIGGGIYQKLDFGAGGGYDGGVGDGGYGGGYGRYGGFGGGGRGSVGPSGMITWRISP